MAGKEPQERDTTVTEPAEVVTTELTALEPISPEMVPSGVFSTTDPAEALRQASRLVEYVNEMIKPRYREFISSIRGRDFPTANWWTAVGQPLGLSPRTVWVKRREDFDDETWEARVEVYNRAGQMISAGQALCSRNEGKDRRPSGKDSRKIEWDSFALYSMAQTRAIGKAYRTPLSFLAVLSGLQPTPAEEMDDEPPIVLAGDAVDLKTLPEDIQTALMILRDKAEWRSRKVQVWLAKFYKDGVLDEAAALAGLNRAIDQANQEAGR